MSLLDTIIGGPIGMGIDGWLGSTTADRPQDGVRRLADMSQEEAKNVFIVTLFSMMAKMAKADGRLSTEEVDLVNHMARSNIVMDAEDQKAGRTPSFISGGGTPVAGKRSSPTYSGD